MNFERYELTARYDSRKSFYCKAVVEVNGTTKTLYSYGVPVVIITPKTVDFTPSAWYSRTTRRHVREFCRQIGISDPYGKQKA